MSALFVYNREYKMNRKGKFKVSKKNKSGKFKPIFLSMATHKLSALSKKIISGKIKVEYVNAISPMRTGKLHPLGNITSISFDHNGFYLTIDDYRSYSAGFIQIYTTKVLDNTDQIRAIISLQEGEFKYAFLKIHETNSYTTTATTLELTIEPNRLDKMSSEEYFQQSIVTDNLDDIIDVYKEAMVMFKAIRPKTCLMNIVRNL